jgi:hypothetical protein
MLNKPAPPQSDDADDKSMEHSESRMLRALEALGGQPPSPQGSQGGQRSEPEPAPPRDEVPFASKKLTIRENFRPDQQHHGNKARHRFVRDGEVPVVHMQVNRAREAAPPPGRSDADWTRLQGLIEEYRLRAEQAERARGDFSNQVKALQTKLAHAELAQHDAQALAQAKAEEVQALQDEIARLKAPPVPAVPQPQAHLLPHAPAPARVQNHPQTHHQSLPASPPPRPIDPATGLPRRGPGRPRRNPLPPEPVTPQEPEPVQWWLLPTKPRRR